MGVVGLEGMNHQNGWLFAFVTVTMFHCDGNRKSLFSLPKNRVAPRHFLGNWLEVEFGGRKSSERSSSSVLTVREHFVPFLQTFENLSKSQSSWSWTACSRTARLPKQSNKHSTFFTSVSVLPSSWPSKTALFHNVYACVECVGYSCVWTWSRCAQAGASISESLRRGLNESHNLSPKEREQRRTVKVVLSKKDQAYGNAGKHREFPTAFRRQHFLNAFAMPACCKAAGKKLFELWKRTEREMISLLPWSATPWLATTRQTERAGTSTRKNSKSDGPRCQLGLDSFEPVPRPNSVSRGRCISFPRRVVSHFSA